MSGLTKALDELMDQHRRIGSPMPDFLRPGLPGESVRRQTFEAVGLDVPPEVLDFFAWHDGIDNEAWKRADVGTGFARLFSDAYFAAVADAIRQYRERIETDETMAVPTRPRAKSGAPKGPQAPTRCPMTIRWHGTRRDCAFAYGSPMSPR